LYANGARGSENIFAKLFLAVDLKDANINLIESWQLGTVACGVRSAREITIRVIVRENLNFNH
jgi:hypothetical protein